jgi:hypothetical protein
MTVDLLGIQVSPGFKKWHDRNCHDCGDNCILLDNRTWQEWEEEAQFCEDTAK